MLFTRRRFVQRIAPVLLAPALVFPAAAEQVQRVAAAGGPDFAKCDQLRDPAASAQCYTDTTVAYHKGRIVRANSEAECADAVATLGRNPKAQDIGRRLLNGKRPSEFGVCKFRDALVAAMQ